MNRKTLLELAYDRSTLDADVIESLTDDQLRELCGFREVEPVSNVSKERKRRALKPAIIKPVLVDFKFIEHDGALYRVETWRTGTIDQLMHIRCGATVRFMNRTMAASIVLHWLRTGDLVKRVPRERKTWQAAVREGVRVKHLGRFATRQERDAVIVNYRLGFIPSK